MSLIPSVVPSVLQSAALNVAIFVHCWLRVPIQPPRGRRIRVLIYARYSTDEQHKSSIDDQVAYCRRFLEAAGVKDAEYRVLKDEAISGEHVSRPGINTAKDCVEAREVDLVVVEDSSRLFRDLPACCGFVGAAVDEGIRVICINDYIDTAEEDWLNRLHESQKHHTQSNEYTSRRIKRKHEALFRAGFAIGLVRSGYQRLTPDRRPANEAEKGPYIDVIDELWTATIIEVYLRIARGELPAMVATWLNTVGLPKICNSRKKSWSGQNVKELIRRTIYRGHERFRDTISKKKHKAGRRKQEKNRPEQVLTREMPTLRIVEDWLWYAANDAIRGRDKSRHAQGRENPQYGIPRDSRGPLSRRFSCACCGSTMERPGPSGYRCALASPRRRGCWNRATAKPQVVHAAVAAALRARLDVFIESSQATLEAIREICGQAFSRETERTNLMAQRSALLSAHASLKAIAEAGKHAPETVLAWVQEKEDQLDRVEASLERLDTEQAALRLPRLDELTARIEELRLALATMDRHSGPLLQTIVEGVEAFPCQQVDSDKVVLRARIKLNLLGLIPAGVAVFLKSLPESRLPEILRPTVLQVDLFEPSSGPKHWRRALELEDQGYGLTQIGKALGITKRAANLARNYGRMMQEAGADDPFIELTEAPSKASRWRDRQPRIRPTSQPESTAIESGASPKTPD